MTRWEGRARLRRLAPGQYVVVDAEERITVQGEAIVGSAVPELEAALSDALDAEAATYAAEAKARTWEYFAGLAFAYYDAPEGTDDVYHAWCELAVAIRHHRAVGGPEPRDPDEHHG